MGHIPLFTEHISSVVMKILSDGWVCVLFYKVILVIISIIVMFISENVMMLCGYHCHNTDIHGENVMLRMQQS